MSIGQRIKELRASKKISQKDLADAIGVSRGNVGDWELDKAKPGADALLALSNYFEVSADSLLKGDVDSRVDARISVHEKEGNITPYEIEFLTKFRQLAKESRIKVEGIVEGLLISQGSHSPQSRTGTSSRSTNGNEREEAAATSESA